MVELSASPVRRSARYGVRASTLLVLILAGFLLGPIMAVFAAALGDSEGLWAHLASTLLPVYVANTVTLMAGTGAVSLAFGVGAAWLVSRYDFPGRRIMEWALLLPAAVPAYIVAYTYTDLLEYAGPVQGALRALFGWTSTRDYWFPEIRSMGGAMLVMGSALYPYVYMMTRIAFRQTPLSLNDVARIHNRSLFLSVALPMARPAMAAGLALVLMETVSDFGTVEYFALETLTLGIFNVWLGMNSLPAAAQIASVATLFVVTLLALELTARSRRRYAGGSRRATGLAVETLGGWRALSCLALCLIPVVMGFALPAAILLSFVLQGYSLDDYGTVLLVAENSVLLAALTAGLIALIATVMVLTVTFRGNRPLRFLAGLSAIGYAFPGTILAIGVLTFSGALDDGLEFLTVDLLGMEDGIYLTGSLALVVIACVVRFHAVGFGALTAGSAACRPTCCMPAACSAAVFPRVCARLPCRSSAVRSWRRRCWPLST
ncbi:MAG: ABC transporter permease [Minwuia sp.]|uniref:ABC transporter permease n=1 Tax=Minwuia sp. TaxID=2493630 RepID=UPI003A861781